jgi:hypothetical protein
MDIGEKLLETSPIHELVEKMHADYVTEEFVENFVKLFKISKEYIYLRDNIGVKLPLKPEIVGSPDYLCYLGLGIIEHDLCNDLSAFSLDDFILRSFKSGETELSEKEKEFEFNREHMLAYENAKSCLSMIPYIVSGDRRFLSQIRSRYVGSLIDNLEDREIRPLSFKLNIDQDFIYSDEYFCMHQLVKNARKNIYSNNSSQLPQNSIHVHNVYNGKYSMISVRDFGNGIGSDKLSKIFGVYTDTERGTGIGLQVVKRLIELREGHGVVISKTRGKNKFGYCITSGVLKEMITCPGVNGSLFKLYLPDFKLDPLC